MSVAESERGVVDKHMSVIVHALKQISNKEFQLSYG